MDFKELNSYNKGNLLQYYRDRTKEYYSEIEKTYNKTDYKKRASAINKSVITIRENILKTLFNLSKKNKLEDQDVISPVLTIYYTSYVVMLEARNYYWPYEYMAFARRIVELWEPFCKIPFEYPVKELDIFIPPTFEDVKKLLTDEIKDYISKLPLSDEQKSELITYYEKVWQLVTSGDIKLELDLHFIQGKNKYVVDYKSGFHSNEKGNTNRLLLVGAIYKNISPAYKPLIFVRSDKDDNNHYLQTLNRSDIWSVHCGKEAYSEICKYTGFDLNDWIEKNIHWKNDISSDFYSYLDKNDLIKYLSW